MEQGIASTSYVPEASSSKLRASTVNHESRHLSKPVDSGRLTTEPEGFSSSDSDDDITGDEWMCGCCSRSRLVINEGSTARDYLARERNFLSWLKLSTTLCIISAALLLRFQFGQQRRLPKFAYESAIPLGILFFISSIFALLVGIWDLFTSDHQYKKHRGFVYAGKMSQLTIWSISALVMTSCLLLLIAD